MAEEEKKKRLNSKSKGNRGELQCVKILNDRFNCKSFQRVPNSGAWGGGKNRERRADATLEQRLTLVSDIMTPSDFSYVLEHKNYEKMDFYDLFNPSSKLNEWIDQVVGDAEYVGKKPMLIVKTNNKNRIVFVNEKPSTPNFTYYRNGKEWHCYWLSYLLENNKDDFFYESK